MRVCGCEIASKEIRVAICYRDNETAIRMAVIDQTRIEIEDDTNDECIQRAWEEIQKFADEHSIDAFCIKERPRKGRMQGGPGTFKLEGLIQLLPETKTVFVNGNTLTAFGKREPIEYPDKLPVYLKNAFLAGYYALDKAA